MAATPSPIHPDDTYVHEVLLPHAVEGAQDVQSAYCTLED